MTQHNQGLSPNRCTSYTFVDDGGSVNIPRLAGINNAALSLTRGEAARAQGDEIVFDVHLPSSCLIVSRACLYATSDESWPVLWPDPYNHSAHLVVDAVAVAPWHHANRPHCFVQDDRDGINTRANFGEESPLRPHSCRF